MHSCNDQPDPPETAWKTLLAANGNAQTIWLSFDRHLKDRKSLARTTRRPETEPDQTRLDPCFQLSVFLQEARHHERAHVIYSCRYSIATNVGTVWKRPTTTTTKTIRKHPTPCRAPTGSSPTKPPLPSPDLCHRPSPSDLSAYLEMVECHAREPLHREKGRLRRVVARASIARGSGGGPRHERHRDRVTSRITPRITFKTQQEKTCAERGA